MKTSPLLWKGIAAAILVATIVGSAVFINQSAARHVVSREETRVPVTSSVVPRPASVSSTSSHSSLPATSPAVSASGFARSSNLVPTVPASSGQWYAASNTSSSASSTSTQTVAAFKASSSVSPPTASSSVNSAAASNLGSSSGGSAFPADIEVIEQAPLPVSAQLAGYEIEGLTPEEQRALNEAQKNFSEDVAAAPSQDTSDPDYYDKWEESRQNNNNRLRSVLGWRTFNSLSSEGAQAMLEQQRAATPAN